MIAALLLAAAAVAAPIGSAEVLASLDERHPVIAAATQELARASALRLQALGAWDVKVKGKIENYDDDASAWDRSEAEFSLPTRLYGARIEGGYALGTGDLPSYYGEKKTSKQGELYAALSVPLLRGGWVDPERTQLAVARLEPAIAEAVRTRAVIEVARDARIAWAKWVAAQRKLRVAEDLLRVANERDVALAQRIEAGDLQPIARLDNQRLILEREATRAEAESDVAAAAATVGLFYRNPDGTPRRPALQEVPSNVSVPDPPAPELGADVARALERRPEPIELATLRLQLAAQRRQSQNDLFPALNAEVEGVLPLKDDYPSELWLRVQLDSPVQQRKARGKLAEIAAKDQAIAQKERFTRDKIDAEVVKARAALEASRIAADRLAKSAELARQLVEAERTRFDLGDTDLLTVWLREQSAADAQKKAIEAWFDAWTARAELDAAIGLRPDELVADTR